MMSEGTSPFLDLLRNRIDLARIPFSDRGSRLMVFRTGDELSLRLAERWFKVDRQPAGYRQAAQSWRERSEKMAALILDQLWDAEAGYFWAHRQGRRIRIRTPFGLFPLITGRYRMEARAAVLSREEAATTLLVYAQRHPFAFREISRLITGRSVKASSDACRRVAEEIPLIRLEPVTSTYGVSSGSPENLPRRS